MTTVAAIALLLPSPAAAAPGHLADGPHRVLAHPCDDGHSVAEVLAYAARATHQVFRPGVAELDDRGFGASPEVRVPVLIMGERADRGPDRAMRWMLAPKTGDVAPENPLALMVQLGRRPFAFYANRLAARNGGPLNEALERDRDFLAMVPCRGGRTLGDSLKASGFAVYYVDLFWAVKSDFRTMEVVVQVQFDRPGTRSTSPPGALKPMQGLAPPQTDHPFATWSRTQGTAAFVPSDAYAQALSEGRPVVLR